MDYSESNPQDQSTTKSLLIVAATGLGKNRDDERNRGGAGLRAE